MQTLYLVTERKLPFTGYNRSLYKDRSDLNRRKRNFMRLILK